MNITYQRPFVERLRQRLRESAPLIQVLVGPRQVGKTTGVRQLITQADHKAHYANADDLWMADRNWLLEQWQQALLLGDGSLLVIDEIQKVTNWPETIKALWDKQPGRLRVLLLGSSSLQIQQIGTALHMIDPAHSVCLAGLGAMQLPVSATAIAMGYGV